MTYTADDLVDVFPFTRQSDAGEVVIGRPDLGVFLALPADAVEILDNLAEGKTVGETQRNFSLVHGETPDIADLLVLLEKKGFVKRHGDAPGSAGGNASSSIPKVRYHFTKIPESLAQRFFGRPALRLYFALMAIAFAIVIFDPSLLPSRYSLYFAEHRTIKILILTALVYTTLFAHEFCHLLAARSEGVQARIGMSNRLWVLVAETDLTGLWAVSREKRYLPMLAGPLSDCVSASLILFALFLHNQQMYHLPSSVIEIARALVFVYMMRLIWQCFFFVRTDFYYVISNFFGCKSLMRDTQIFLRNLVARTVGRSIIDQSHIPQKEQRVIRAYSLLWLVGRGLAFATLFLVTLPVLFRYLDATMTSLRAGFASGPYRFLDSLLVSLVSLVPLVTGLTLWLTGLFKRRTT